MSIASTGLSKHERRSPGAKGVKDTLDNIKAEDRIARIGHNKGPALDDELARAVDDQRVMTIPQWCEVCGFSVWTGKRLLKAGKGPPITQISDRRIGITVGNNARWQASRVR